MKMNYSKIYLLACICMLFILSSCKKEEPSYRIPGSFKAMQMLSQARAYPEAEIPNGAYGRGVLAQQAFQQSSGRPPGEPWEAMGPLNTSGRCLALAVNPEADSTIYLGSASGGLWRSRRLGLGLSWEYVPVGHGVLGVSSIDFAPGDSLEMYIGTGEVYNINTTGNDGAYRSTRGSYGVGILKSSDGGQTWVKSLDWTYQNHKGVQAVRVDPNDRTRVFAATTDGVYRSQDAGDTWDLVFANEMSTDIEIIGDNILTICGNLGSTNKGMFYSTDGGDSWQQNLDDDIPTDFQGKGLLAVANSNTDVVYASIGNGFWFDDGATWLLRSDDAGISWELRNTEDYSRWQGWFSHDIAVSPDNENEVAAIGINIFKSTDGGNTLTAQSNGGVTLGTNDPAEPDGPPDYSHSDHHVVMYHPTLQDVVLYGNDGGLFLSFDRGETFRSANGGMQTTQFYNGFSVSHQNPDFAMGGLQDNSTSIHRGDKIWQRAVGGDGSWTGIDFQDDNNVFASSQNLNVARSNNNGQNFFGVNIPGLSPAIFIAPYQISESNPSIIYAGSEHVLKSTNGGTAWQPTNLGNPLNGDPIYAMAISSTNSDIVYASTAPEFSSSAVFLTTDGGNVWNDITNGLPDRYVNDLYVDPNNDGAVYAALNGFGTGHLYFSEDFGQNWTDLSTDLPDLPGNAVLVDPVNSNNIYFGNDMGVYFSDNKGESWVDFGQGLFGSVIAIDLEYSPVDRKIWVATHGNGTFRRDMVPTEVSVDDIVGLYGLEVSKVFPNPIASRQNLQMNLKTAKNLSLNIQVVNVQSGVGVYKSQTTLNKGENNLQIPLENIPAGVYNISLISFNQVIENQSFIVQ